LQIIQTLKNAENRAFWQELNIFSSIEIQLVMSKFNREMTSWRKMWSFLFFFFKKHCFWIMICLQMRNYQLAYLLRTCYSFWLFKLLKLLKLIDNSRFERASTSVACVVRVVKVVLAHVLKLCQLCQTRAVCNHIVWAVATLSKLYCAREAYNTSWNIYNLFNYLYVAYFISVKIININILIKFKLFNIAMRVRNA
jgi:hypothetical protein